MSPEMMCDPPNIDPREHAIESCHWGACSCHLVRHEGRYYVWMAAAAGGLLVYPMVDEAAAAASSMTGRRPTCCTRHGTSSRPRLPARPRPRPEIAATRGRATASAGDTGGRARIIYHSAVIDVEDDGIWVVSYEDTGDDDEAGDTRHHALYTPVRFDDLGPALDAFAARAERAADRVERERVSSVPEVVAGVLRYRAAEARATAARARVGTRSAAPSGGCAPPGPSAPWPAPSAFPVSSCTGFLLAMSGPGPAAGEPPARLAPAGHPRDYARRLYHGRPSVRAGQLHRQRGRQVRRR